MDVAAPPVSSGQRVHVGRCVLVTSFDLADSETGNQLAVLDLAWPNGLQEKLSQPVAVLLNEDAATIALASRSGFRCFTAISDVRRYVNKEVLADADPQQGAGVAA